MDEFRLTIDPLKFRSTNAPWNQLMLNDPWSVGYVTTIIELKPLANKETWEDFYYETGEFRERKIATLTKDKQEALQNEGLVRTDQPKIKSLLPDEIALNTLLGRTFRRLEHKGDILFNSVKNNGFGLTLSECVECVRFRVIGETWNGVVVRERNTIKTLQKQFPHVEFIKVPGEIDHQFAVDYEVFKRGVLCAAIQIKPPSYTWSAPYIDRARRSNRHKNEKYTELKNVRVYDIISNSNGSILNAGILGNL